MWMGGLVPLGYDREGRKLVPNPKEEELVSKIFTLYLEVGCVRKLAEQLDREKIRSKVWITRTGARLGGVAFARGALYNLLRNRLYIGEIRHRDQWYPGEHKGIAVKPLSVAICDSGGGKFVWPLGKTVPLRGNCLHSLITPTHPHGAKSLNLLHRRTGKELATQVV
jgi:Recombinase